MKCEVIMKEFEIHTTPLEKIIIDDCTVEISLDDINEKRYRIIAEPIQAVRFTTIDCVFRNHYYNEYCFRDGRYHRHILQIKDSILINELKSGLVEKRATFLNNAKHYALLLQDNLIEIVAWDLTVEEINRNM